jgi:hypothetical protein
MTMKDIAIDFTHKQSAHCETGVLSSLPSFHGFELSEALCFGIGSGLFFGYFPFVSVHGLPLITFRSSPGAIFKKVTQRLGITLEHRKFRDPENAMGALDTVLDQGIPVGLRAGMFWLPYFPSHFRFHFNAHNLIVYGREGSGYLISDPVLDEPAICSRRDLVRARFAEGLLAPKGTMYYVTGIPSQVDLRQAILKGIRDVSQAMLTPTVPFIGIWAIHHLADRIRSWPKKLGAEKALIHLGHMIRMQEEIGTGGGGFRLIYAAFLQDASGVLNDKRLHDLSGKMTLIGDRWREFALHGARICKGRVNGENSYNILSDILHDCGHMEKELLREIRKATS